MIKEKLLDFQYYLDRLSIFMKESYGMQEHVEIFFQQLLLVNKQFDYLFEQLDIFNKFNLHDNEEWISDLIDKIGAIFGCYRNFTINYKENGENKLEELNLNDEEFLYYIKCQIVKQNFQGSREELAKIYTTYEMGQKINGLLDLVMVYVIYQTQTPMLLNTVTCNIYWSNSNEDKYTDNLKKLFLGGYLTIESMGILYNRILQNINGLAIFASSDTQLSDGDYYRFSSLDNDYYYCTINNKYYIYDTTVSTNYKWRESDEAGTGLNRGNITSVPDIPNNVLGGLPPFIQGGFFG